jgi:hypothetical protein
MASISYVEKFMKDMEHLYTEQMCGLQSGVDRRFNAILQNLENISLPTQPTPLPQWNTPPPPVQTYRYQTPPQTAPNNTPSVTHLTIPIAVGVAVVRV